METLLRLQINAFALLVILIIWVSGDRRMSPKIKEDVRIFRALMAATVAMLVLDGLGWLLDGTPGVVGRVAVQAVNVCYFATHTLPITFYFGYAILQIFWDGDRARREMRPFFALAAVVAVTAFVSPFTGTLFTTDDGNHYVRGNGFLVFGVVQYGLVVFALALIIRHRRSMRRKVFYTLLAYPVPALLGAGIQWVMYGFVLIWPMVTLFLVAAATNLENRRARTDYLTGTANRRSLDEELERRVSPVRPFCGLLVDVDDFKAINDAFGHEAGDRALEDVATILLSSVRVEDVVARIGGDEFVVLVDIDHPRAMDELVLRVEEAVARYNASGKRPFRLSLSIGRCACEGISDGDPSEFMARLDADMYTRKREKKGNSARPGRVSGGWARLPPTSSAPPTAPGRDPR